MRWTQWTLTALVAGGLAGASVSAQPSPPAPQTRFVVVLDAEKVREQTNIRYLRDAAEAVDQVSRGEADVVFLTNPVSMEQLKEVAFAGDVMPQKSTDFYPKLLSGLTIYALD
jgi:uncharacterized protein (DUF1015 family)